MTTKMPLVLSTSAESTLAHGGAEADGWPAILSLPVVVVVVAAAAYTALAVAERQRRGWSTWRLSSFLLGCVLLGWAVSPQLDAAADADFGVHMAQHLLLAMVAPLALVLGAPVTLVLRSLPHRQGRVLGRALHSRPVRMLARPWVALVLSSGGVVAVYFTPLYSLTTTHEWLHEVVHLHFFVAGYLFAWVIAGPDPAPRRASVRTRIVVLGVAVAVHASVAQLLYAGLFVAVDEPAAQLQAAGDLMYFGGDIAELLLALAMLLTWRAGGRDAAASPGRTGDDRHVGRRLR